ncbi:MAG: putative ERCC4 domain-containing protein [Prokaryotic dsDNA virus sp.]|jgi:ERCC4-type nuclease|nr:MAG: putative ERCC4 domain-containing protein [Prokaryotic dsDNA virus sp.]|tara:strand:+ start:9091 stop:9513 length:423 start_codon:yes stop_codon:yes gene_type:complete
MYKIVVDSREQKPLWKKNLIVKKLDVGDYSIEGYENKIAIERKSLSDLFGTLGGGHKRFKKELERAESYEYFAIVIEGNYRSIRDKKFEGSFYCKMKGYVIIKILFTLHMKYKINFFMVNDRNEAKSVIKSLFNTYITLQ